VFLKQSTVVTLKIGPFVDSTDGATAETGLSIAQADVRLSKNGGDIAQKTESTSCTHDELGIYGCPLDATDTATLGRLQLWVHESGALPVWHEYMVVPANAYDSLVGGSDALDVNVAEVSGDSAAADKLEAFADSLVTGTAQDGGSASITLAAGESAVNDIYEGRVVCIIAGTGAGQASVVDGYTGSSKVASVAEGWATTPDATSVYLILPAGPADMQMLNGQGNRSESLEAFIEALGSDDRPLISTDAQDLSATLDVNAKLLEGADPSDTINAAVDVALNTAIPGSPTADSINQRIKAIDDLTQASGAGDLAAILADTGGGVALADGAITAAKIATNAITAAKIAADAIGASELATDAVAAIAAAVHLAGAGAITFTYTLTLAADSSAIADADVWVTSDEAGNTLVASGETDENGQVVFYLDAGDYYVWAQKAGYNFTNPDKETVS